MPKKILWISPYSLHDRISERARQALRMVKALSRYYQHEVCVLTPTIFTSSDPLALEKVASNSLLNSQESFQLIDDDHVTFVYIRTFSQSFQDMTASEQRDLLNEFTPMLVDFKPDLVMANNCDVITLCCLNLAKLAGLSTAFVLQETLPSFFSFADVDLILSTSHPLIARHVTPLKRIAAYIGPFVPMYGPLAPALTEDTDTPAAAATEDSAADSDSKKSAEVSAAPEIVPISALEVAKRLKAGKSLKGGKKSTEKKRVLLFDPSLEHGLGIFLELYKHMRESGKLSALNLEFVVLETYSDQFTQVLSQYYERGGLKAYERSDFKDITVIAPTDDQKDQLQELLPTISTVIQPTLCVAGTSFIGMQALSYGLGVITTDQEELRDLLGEFGSYIDVQQSVINNLSALPPESEILKWETALEESLERKIDPEALKSFLERYKFDAGEYRLLIALMPLLAQCRSYDPHLMHNCAFSMRIVRKQQALESAMREAAASLLDNSDKNESDEDEEENILPTLSNNFD